MERGGFTAILQRRMVKITIKYRKETKTRGRDKARDRKAGGKQADRQINKQEAEKKDDYKNQERKQEKGEARILKRRMTAESKRKQGICS